MSEDAITPAPQDSPWISKITDAEIVGAAQTKGWDKLDPVEAFHQAARSHRAAERMLGAPADHLLRLPTRDDDEAGWRNVWSRLGAPEKAEDYAIDDLKLQDPELNQQFHDSVRQTAHELGMPKAMAERMAQAFHKFIDNSQQRLDTEKSAGMKAEQDRLAADWGQPGTDRFRANMFVADRAAQNLGVSPEAMEKLKDGLGASEVAKMFHKIGVSMGEDRYVTGSNPVNNGIMSREQAIARRSELMADQQWVQRYLGGGAPEKREMLGLNTLIAG